MKNQFICIHKHLEIMYTIVLLNTIKKQSNREKYLNKFDRGQFIKEFIQIK